MSDNETQLNEAEDMIIALRAEVERLKETVKKQAYAISSWMKEDDVNREELSSLREQVRVMREALDAVEWVQFDSDSEGGEARAVEIDGKIQGTMIRGDQAEAHICLSSYLKAKRVGFALPDAIVVPVEVATEKANNEKRGTE